MGVGLHSGGGGGGGLETADTDRQSLRGRPTNTLIFVRLSLSLYWVLGPD